MINKGCFFGQLCPIMTLWHSPFNSPLLKKKSVVAVLFHKSFVLFKKSSILYTNFPFFLHKSVVVPKSPGSSSSYWLSLTSSILSENQNNFIQIGKPKNGVFPCRKTPLVDSTEYSNSLGLLCTRSFLFKLCEI